LSTNIDWRAGAAMNESKVVVGAPTVRGALALFPLTSTAPSAPDYVTGPEAVKARQLRISEVGGGSVPHLVVENTGELAVLLLEGETILGLKQNRTLVTSVLIPPNGASVTVSVSCVERGRWGQPHRVGRSRRHAPGDLRRVQHLGRAAQAFADSPAASDQIAIWRAVAAYETRFGTTSHSSALEDVYEHTERELASMTERLRPAVDQRGVATAIGGQVRGVDLFDKPSTLAAYWEALIAGAALDALVPGADAPAHASEVINFLERLERVSADTISAPGIGTHWLLHGAGVAGHALEWNGARVHMAAFAAR
jgi:hypothetical protein